MYKRQVRLGGLKSGWLGGKSAKRPGAGRTAQTRSSVLCFLLQALAQLRGTPTRGSTVSDCWGPARVFLAFLMQIWRWVGGAREEPVESNLRRVGHYSLGLVFL